MDSDTILSEAEDFARSKPWAVLAGGVALGIVAARFLKASSADRASQSAAAGRRLYRDGQRDLGRSQRRVARRHRGRPGASVVGASGSQRTRRSAHRWPEPRAAGPAGSTGRRLRASAMANGSPPPEGLRESSLGELVQRLANETSQLVHQEIELAKAEMTEKGKRAGIGAGMFGGAGVVGLLALGALTGASPSC